MFFLLFILINKPKIFKIFYLEIYYLEVCKDKWNNCNAISILVMPLCLAGFLVKIKKSSCHLMKKSEIKRKWSKKNNVIKIKQQPEKSDRDWNAIVV